MQKEKLLSELYNGNLCPIAKEVVQGSEYQKCMHELAEIEEEFSSQLNAKEKEKLIDIVARLSRQIPWAILINHILPVCGCIMLPYQVIPDNNFLQEFDSQGRNAIFRSCMCE